MVVTPIDPPNSRTAVRVVELAVYVKPTGSGLSIFEKADTFRHDNQNGAKPARAVLGTSVSRKWRNYKNVDGR
ncbi:MAG TPA: hypothetical protein VI756_27140 [Blastocatellia bacterium]